MSDRISKRGKNLFLHLILISGAVLALSPFVWMISTSFKTADQVFTIPIQFIPAAFHWENFRLPFQQQAQLPRYFLNSILVTCLITVSTVFFSALTGYSLAKFQYRGRTLFFLFILSTMMIPYQLLMVPHFLIAKKLNLLNSYLGLFLPYAMAPFGVFLMRQYLLGIPRDLIEAARIDGASELRIYAQIVMPLCKPALAALGVFTFREAWDMYIWPLIIVTKDSLRPVPLGISLFMSSYGTAWDQLMAIATIGTLPMILLFFFLQRSFIQGIAITGLKE